MGKKKERPLTPAEVQEWIKGQIEHSTTQALLHVHKYDNAILTKADMMVGVKEEVRRLAHKMYDTGFADGVNGSVDVEDEDNPVAFEIEEDDEDDPSQPRRS